MLGWITIYYKLISNYQFTLFFIGHNWMSQSNLIMSYF